MKLGREMNKEVVEKAQVSFRKRHLLSKENMCQIMTFLKLTQDGKFAEIEENSLAYARLGDLRENFSQEEYFYSWI